MKDDPAIMFSIFFEIVMALSYLWFIALLPKLRLEEVAPAGQ
jgi:hypothetical protein